MSKGQMKFIVMTCWTPPFGGLSELLAKYKVPLYCPLYWNYTIHHMFYFFRDGCPTFTYFCLHFPLEFILPAVHHKPELAYRSIHLRN